MASMTETPVWDLRQFAHNRIIYADGSAQAVLASLDELLRAQKPTVVCIELADLREVERPVAAAIRQRFATYLQEHILTAVSLQLTRPSYAGAALDRELSELVPVELLISEKDWLQQREK